MGMKEYRLLKRNMKAIAKIEQKEIQSIEEKIHIHEISLKKRIQRRDDALKSLTNKQNESEHFADKKSEALEQIQEMENEVKEASQEKKEKELELKHAEKEYNDSLAEAKSSFHSNFPALNEKIEELKQIPYSSKGFPFGVLGWLVLMAFLLLFLMQWEMPDGFDEWGGAFGAYLICGLAPAFPFIMNAQWKGSSIFHHSREKKRRKLEDEIRTLRSFRNGEIFERPSHSILRQVVHGLQYELKYLREKKSDPIQMKYNQQSAFINSIPVVDKELAVKISKAEIHLGKREKSVENCENDIIVAQSQIEDLNKKIGDLYSEVAPMIPFANMLPEEAISQ